MDRPEARNGGGKSRGGGRRWVLSLGGATRARSSGFYAGLDTGTGFSDKSGAVRRGWRERRQRLLGACACELGETEMARARTTEARVCRPASPALPRPQNFSMTLAVLSSPPLARGQPARTRPPHTPQHAHRIPLCARPRPAATRSPSHFIARASATPGAPNDGDGPHADRDGSASAAASGECFDTVVCPIRYERASRPSLASLMCQADRPTGPRPAFALFFSPRRCPRSPLATRLEIAAAGGFGTLGRGTHPHRG